MASCQTGIVGSGIVAEEIRETAPFHSIDIKGSYRIFLSPDNYSSLKIKADDNFMEHIVTYVEGGELVVESNKNFNDYQALELYITVKDLEGIELAGACDLKSKGTFSSDEMDIELAGAIELSLAIACEDLSVEMAGACEANLSGTATEASFDGAGASTINAENLITQICHVDMAGSGEAKVHATKELDIDAAGAVDVYYAGKPKKLTQNMAGASSVKAL